MFDALVDVVGFERWWRVTLTWQSGMYSPTGDREQVIEVRTAARLRAAVLAARADSRVERYGYRLVREWVEDGAVARCRRGMSCRRSGCRSTLAVARPAGTGAPGVPAGMSWTCQSGVRGAGRCPYDPEAGAHYW